LINPDKFKAPFIPNERIWHEAERLRAAHPVARQVPVQVLDLAEFGLDLDLIPAEGLREQLEIDALLIGSVNEARCAVMLSLAFDLKPNITPPTVKCQSTHTHH
jgi:hypothetical protein